jgi:hypothetical protein
VSAACCSGEEARKKQAGCLLARVGGRAGCVMMMAGPVWLAGSAGWLARRGWLARPRPPCVAAASQTEPNSGARKLLLAEWLRLQYASKLLLPLPPLIQPATSKTLTDPNLPPPTRT